jgi:hypothetical protein
MKVETLDGVDYQFAKIKSARLVQGVITIINCHNISISFVKQSEYPNGFKQMDLGGILKDADFSALANHFYLSDF